MLKPIMNNLRYTTSPLLLLFLLLTPLTLYGEEASGLPIDITARSVTFEQERDIIIYRDDVIATQGAWEIQADYMQILLDDGEVSEIEGRHNVEVFHRPEEQEDWLDAESEQIFYYPDRELIVLVKDAKVTRNGDTVTADRINYHLDTDQIHAISEGQQRVHFRVLPKKGRD